MKIWIGRYAWAVLALSVVIGGCNNNPKPTEGETTGTTTTGTTTGTEPPKVAETLRTDGFRYMGLDRVGDVTFEYVKLEGAAGESGTQAVETLSATPEKATFKFVRGGALSALGSETYEARPDGVYLTAMELGELENPMLSMPGDVKVGSKWTSSLKTKETAKQPFQFTIENVAEKEEEIKLKGGTFTALLVTGKGTMNSEGKPQTMLYKTWYVKDIGPVLLRIEVKLPDGKSTKNSLELVKLGAAAKPATN